MTEPAIKKSRTQSLSDSLLFYCIIGVKKKLFKFVLTVLSELEDRIGSCYLNYCRIKSSESYWMLKELLEDELKRRYEMMRIVRLIWPALSVKKFTTCNWLHTILSDECCNTCFYWPENPFPITKEYLLPKCS